jgi:hypothetical protein
VSQALMRRIAAVAASAALLSGVAATGGEAFAAAACKHPAHHVTHQPKRNARHGWDEGATKKDRWDTKHHCRTRWDADSRSYAKWDAKHHCWTRSHRGHAQRWDMKHHCWK